MQPLRVPAWRAEHRRYGEGRVRLGRGGDELAGRYLHDVLTQLGQEYPHYRAPSVRRPRADRRPDQGPQPAVPGAGEIQDVRVDLLTQPSAGDAEYVGDLPARECSRLRAQEELAGLAVEYDQRKRRLGQPPLAAHVSEPLVVDLPGQVGCHVVEDGQVQVSHGRHGSSVGQEEGRLL